MISANPRRPDTITLLIRYGTIPEVARFAASPGEADWQRGQQVVVQSHRGVEMGTILEQTRGTAGEPGDEALRVLRPASDADLETYAELQSAARDEYDAWAGRIAEWKLELELIDLEWLLDREKLVLYVLNDRGGDCTKLALYAAAGGHGSVEVQPVNAEGLVQMPQVGGGGCGTGGGGCGSCGTD